VIGLYGRKTSRGDDRCPPFRPHAHGSGMIRKGSAKGADTEEKLGWKKGSLNLLNGDHR